MINDYVAFDFETASGKNPCSIGIIEFRKGEIVNTFYSLINPEIDKFNPIAKRIHGISEADVLGKDNFEILWQEISHFFENRIIISHNSSFDISVLHHTLNRYKLKVPKYECFCTLRLSRKFLSLPNYKLSSLANHYNIEQNNYHNALEDALVCGKVFFSILENISDFDNFKKENQYIPGKSSSFKKKKNDSKVIKPSFDLVDIPETNKLSDLRFVVSGVFEKVSRSELKKIIETNGGKVTGSISAKTNYLVAGENMGPSKLAKAEKLGTNIVSEDEFLAMVE